VFAGDELWTLISLCGCDFGRTSKLEDSAARIVNLLAVHPLPASENVGFRHFANNCRATMALSMTNTAKNFAVKRFSIRFAHPT